MSDRSSIEETVRALRDLETDHTPDGYPAVTMRQITQILNSREFYQRRCDAIQDCQSQMRDPERTMVCDILANGSLLSCPGSKDRYSRP